MRAAAWPLCAGGGGVACGVTRRWGAGFCVRLLKFANGGVGACTLPASCSRTKLSLYAGDTKVEEADLLMTGHTEAQQRENVSERGMGRVIRTCLSNELT